MKYYLIAGEASGDLHASRLMQSLKREDPEARFRFFGGDMMAAAGGTCVRHYREMAYMGFLPVLLHLPSILSNMRMCKRDIVEWNPDVVILVDYPGFNLSIAKYLQANVSIPVYYYISPKIWAWKEYRIKNIRRDIAEMFCILPFETDFYEGKHHYHVNYVGNPTVEEVASFRSTCDVGLADFGKPVIALLAGSRRQEIKGNLPSMIEAVRAFPDYKPVLAGAPGIERAYYDQFVCGTDVTVVENMTYPLLAKASAALVTSGTATLETALFGVPQVVCYETPLPKLTAFLRRHVLKVRYISLVNLIANREVVPELVADTFSVANMRAALADILPGAAGRRSMLDGYAEVARRLGTGSAPDNAARLMVGKLRKLQRHG